MWKSAYFVWHPGYVKTKTVSFIFCLKSRVLYLKFKSKKLEIVLI